MNKIILSSILLTASCAHGKAVATNIVAASDVAADTLADSWEAGTTARIAECRKLALETAAERSECMGKFHPDETEKVIAAVKTLVLVQLAIKEAAECEELKTCVTNVDWAVLAKQAQAAWGALKPYLKTVKGLD